MRPDADYLDDILDAAARVAAYLAGRSEEAFLADPQVQDAVLYRLAVIGEAAGKLSAGAKALRPDIPWRKIVAMRNILVHDYGGTDVGIAYRTAAVHVPELVAAVQDIKLRLTTPPAPDGPTTP